MAPAYHMLFSLSTSLVSFNVYWNSYCTDKSIAQTGADDDEDGSDDDDKDGSDDDDKDGSDNDDKDGSDDNDEDGSDNEDDTSTVLAVVYLVKTISTLYLHKTTQILHTDLAIM